MSRDALEAVRLAVDEVKSVITTLTADEWQQPSGCAGWRVQDLVAVGSPGTELEFAL